MSTPTEILNSAEKLFASKGFRAVSLREITKAAGTNLASVNYHFGDKESLYLAVIRRRIRPINAQRLEMLEQLTNPANASGEDHLDAILRALAGPVLAAHCDPDLGGPYITRIVARSFTDPLPFAEPMLAEEFHPVITRFSQALRRYVGHLPPREFLWRFSFVIGAMQHTLGVLHQMSNLTKGICRSDDHEEALAHFVASARAVLTAPAASPITPALAN